MAQRAIGVEGPIPENALVGALDTPDETKLFRGVRGNRLQSSGPSR